MYKNADLRILTDRIVRFETALKFGKAILIAHGALDGTKNDTPLSGAAAREQVGRRARELAVMAGHAPPYVTQRDYEQAKRDVTGETVPALQDALLDAA